jgi:hypothetical protein
VYEKQRTSFDCIEAPASEVALAMLFTAVANRSRLIFDHSGCVHSMWGVL